MYSLTIGWAMISSTIIAMLIMKATDNEEREGEQGEVFGMHTYQVLDTRSTPMISQSKKVEYVAPLPPMKV